MSLSLWLAMEECPMCLHSESSESFNYTYNVSPMWYAIYPNQEHMIDVDGLTGKQSLPLLECALNILQNEPDKFIALNPANGWGSYDGFKQFIFQLIELAEEYPEWIWEASR